MNKTCITCQTNFDIHPEDQAFYDKVSPVLGGVKYAIPTPTLCPDCRQQRRLSWRNERKLYRRTCDFSKKSIISIYSQDKPLKVYAPDIWWSEKWDATSYGREFDFSKNFFEQWEALNREVPKLALVNDNGLQSDNCEYTNDFAFGKNCYFVFTSYAPEYVYYSNFVNWSRESCDISISPHCNGLYFSVDCSKCAQSVHLVNSSNSRNCYFSYDLKNCSNCVFSFGLRGKEYFIKNKQATKEEYEAFMTQLHLDTHTGFSKAKAIFASMLPYAPRRNMNLKNCENSEGDYLVQCKNTVGYDAFECSDAKYVFMGEKAKDSYDIDVFASCEQCYECITPDNSFGSIATILSWKNTNVYYANDCHSLKDCFGCVGLRNSQYCILNKQYTKEEYEALVPKIIEHMKKTGEWGEFFPMHASPFAYNETVAQEYYPVTKEVAKSKGIAWIEENKKEYLKQNMELPDSIKDTTQSVLNELLACEVCEKNYRVIPQELAFYMQNSLPIPRLCADCRHKERTQGLRNERKLFDRNCHKCQIHIKTTYAPNGNEKVYCEPCYETLIY